MRDEGVHSGLGVLVHVLAACLRDKAEGVPQHVSDEFPPVLISRSVLEQAVSLVEVRLEDPPLGVVQGVLDQPDDVPLAEIGRTTANRLQQLNEDLPTSAMPSLSAVHVRPRRYEGRLYVGVNSHVQDTLQLQV
ncbi:hypothetical protein [Streptomyces sp. NPDC021224]|uniref:hypothetical protein n=1 Tax=unclassified Streptomyces TaxID=2593676 RepID=UPI00379D2121